MQPNTSVPTTKTVASKDGTSIDYVELGSGPGLVLVQGTMGTAHNFKELSEVLAEHFTVYVPDRRDRGMSGAGKSAYSIEREIEDIDALLTATGARYVFGLSSGAIIGLEAALQLPAIQKLAIYEPPLFADKQAVPVNHVERYEAELARGNTAGALIAGMKAGQFAPAIMNMIPERWLEKLVNMGMNQEAKKGTNGYLPMRDLAPTLHNDFALVTALAGNLERFKALQVPTLLLGGTKSQAYLRQALDALEPILPHAQRVVLPGANHGAAWNSDRGGKPQLVAAELQNFFLHD